jgi:hypothetical protein
MDTVCQPFYPFSVSPRRCPAAREYVPLFCKIYIHWFFAKMEQEGLQEDMTTLFRVVNLAEMHRKNRSEILSTEVLQKA